ncbi:ABC transporter permease [Sandaracinomonas limnophila]|uniref:ABC transporter permease n=1 Tax=Sandaracinomonas limnophila TaxID=1862386 RepID=A0A437PP44_9BACT|nr:FtsX-like permease family protein [Sandaracinomonas limnophila]RVU24062.1 ABC transporter permease [Sandaracinomonas limnophila]
MLVIISMAWRNIWRNKARSFVIMFSVALGIFAGLMVMALYKGMMRDRIKALIYQETGHLQLHNPSFKNDYEVKFTIDNLANVNNLLTQNRHVKKFTLRSIAQGMLATTNGSAGLQINGIDPASENNCSELNKKIIIGQVFSNQKKYEIIIGQKLSKKMKISLGDKVVLTFTDHTDEIVSGAFRVVGIMQTSNSAWEERNVYVQRNELNELLGLPNGAHEIAVILNSNEELPVAMMDLKSKMKSVLLEDWKKLSPETELMVDTVDITSYIIMVIILIALAFGIINTMLMSILERTREIGMMMALGMNKLKLFVLVLMETTFLTLSGLPLGIIAAISLSNYIAENGFSFGANSEEMMRKYGFGTTIYTDFAYEKLAMTILFVVTTAFISCLYPAIRALKLNPMEALRK